MSTIVVIIIAIIIIGLTHIMWRKDAQEFNSRLSCAEKSLELTRADREKSENRYYDYICNSQIKMLSENNKILGMAVKNMSEERDGNFIVRGGTIYSAKRFEKRIIPGESEKLSIDFEKVGEINE